VHSQKPYHNGAFGVCIVQAYQQRKGFDMDLLTNEQIRAFYDSHPNVTLRQLSALTGLDIASLKLILMTKG